MFIKLKSNVKHNGENYVGGQKIEIDDIAAQILVDSDVAEKSSAPKSEEPVEAKKPLEKRNKKELLAEAKEKGLEVSGEMTNAEIVEAIKGE